MILLIDNYDSFTYNLYQQITALGTDTKVVKNDQITIPEIESLKPTHIIISPGPGRPENSKISLKTIEHFHKTTPILGVCLGHQAIGLLFGSKIIQAKEIMHGKTSKINHTGTHLFKNLPQNLKVARYHSLAIDKTPQNFTKTAWADDQEIMTINHNKYPLHGIQFHPESFMTEQGNQIIKNFLNA